MLIKGKGPSVENVAAYAFDGVVAHITEKFPGRGKSYVISVTIIETENNLFTVEKTVTI